MFRAKCRWIENGEHPIKFFSILKKLITTKKLSVNLDYKITQDDASLTGKLKFDWDSITKQTE